MKALLLPEMNSPAPGRNGCNFEREAMRRGKRDRRRAVGVQEDPHRVRRGIRHGQIGRAVAVKVAHGQTERSGAAARAEGCRRGESAIAIAQQDANVVAAVVGHGQVGLAVIIEVPDRDAAGIDAARAVRGGGGGKGAIAVVQKDADGAAGIVRHGQVGLAVAVEIAHRHTARIRAARAIRGGGGGKSAIAVVQEDADGAIVVIGHGQIGLAVAVEVGYGQGRADCCRPSCSSCKLENVPLPLPISTVTVPPL